MLGCKSCALDVTFWYNKCNAPSSISFSKAIFDYNFLILLGASTPEYRHTRGLEGSLAVVELPLRAGLTPSNATGGSAQSVYAILS